VGTIQLVQLSVKNIANAMAKRKINLLHRGGHLVAWVASQTKQADEAAGNVLGV
jgi:hypothetical protein